LEVFQKIAQLHKVLHEVSKRFVESKQNLREVFSTHKGTARRLATLEDTDKLRRARQEDMRLNIAAMEKQNETLLKMVVDRDAVFRREQAQREAARAASIQELKNELLKARKEDMAKLYKALGVVEVRPSSASSDMIF
jgi:hypothetical protein